MTTELKPNQIHFINAYMETSNATQAYIKAGYISAHPDKAACQLMSNPNIKQEIQKRRDLLTEKHNLTADYKLKVLADGIRFYASKNIYDKAASLIETANKMQGHNAPEKNINLNASVHIDRVKEALIKYKDY